MDKLQQELEQQQIALLEHRIKELESKNKQKVYNLPQIVQDKSIFGSFQFTPEQSEDIQRYFDYIFIKNRGSLPAILNRLDTDFRLNNINHHQLMFCCMMLMKI